MALLFLLYLVLSTPATPDLFIHLLSGNLILKAGRIPKADVFSFTAVGRPWHNHEWLYAVTLSAVADLLGAFGLHLVRLLLVFSTFLLLFLQVRSRLPPATRPLAYFLLLPVALLCQPGFSFRPHLITYFSIALLPLLLPPDTDRFHFHSFLFVPLITLWANCHGGFIIGLGYLSVWLLGGFFEKHFPANHTYRGPLRPLLFLLLLSFPATLINPYGFSLWQWLVRGLTNPLTGTHLSEWRAWNPKLRSPTTWAFFVLGAATLAAICREILRHRCRSAFLLSAGLAGALLAVRNLPLFALLVPVPLAAAFRSEVKVKERHERNSSRSASIRIVSNLALAVALFAVLLRLPSPATLFLVRIPDRMPRREMLFLRTIATPYRNLGTPLNWGTYLSWHLWPRYRVSLDLRYDTVYPLETIREWQFQIFRGTADALPLLDRYGAEIVLAPRHGPLEHLLASDPHWTARFSGPNATVFFRKPLLSLSAGR
ncbi:MAG: hypothetical protein D6679_04840 [Candidatus Hydrogenedentota bacterium]|nr:MAG: hypothetical protein D6679_04840 [Candidatus Hydrogenedentota bacterium]